MVGDIVSDEVWFATIDVAKGMAREGARVRLKGINKGNADV